MDEKKKAYCLNCGKKQDAVVCSCGCGIFVLGEDGKDYIKVEKGVICICGNNTFNLNGEINRGDVHTHINKCTKCGKLIITNNLAVYY